MVDLDQHIRKFIEGLPQAMLSRERLATWEEYIDAQPIEVAEELRRIPYIEAANLLTRTIHAISDQARDGTPFPAHLDADLRRPGRLEFEGDRELVGEITRSLAEDVLARGGSPHKKN